MYPVADEVDAGTVSAVVASVSVGVDASVVVLTGAPPVVWAAAPGAAIAPTASTARVARGAGT